ncbi:MAG: phage holin family protein [Oscillospiraceae bacterium]|nr:phage holin family protein [Oscillospiraceae bacterium]
MDFGIAGVAVITVIAYLVGLAVKATALPNRWIPVICAAVGGALGVAGLYTMPDFPAADMLTAIAVGIVSGLAATGIDQTVKQLGSKELDGNG